MLAKINREPVVIWDALAAPLLMAAAMLLPWGENTIGVIQAAILAITGLLAAGGLRTDAFFAALTGFAKAIVALFLTFGLPVSESLQTFILTAITIIGAAVVVRPQVSAKVLPVANNLTVEGEWRTG